MGCDFHIKGDPFYRSSTPGVHLYQILKSNPSARAFLSHLSVDKCNISANTCDREAQIVV